MLAGPQTVVILDGGGSRGDVLNHIDAGHQDGIFGEGGFGVDTDHEVIFEVDVGYLGHFGVEIVGVVEHVVGDADIVRVLDVDAAGFAVDEGGVGDG
jgi:hypothetical protein